MKFKIGNKVAVRLDSRFERGEYAGRIGKIKSIHDDESSSTHPYLVDFDGFDRVYFHANELERR